MPKIASIYNRTALV